MSNIGSLEFLPQVNRLISRELRFMPRRRQVVGVVLMPDQAHVCLCMSYAAYNDGRNNWGPPQGGIKKGEELFEAAARELQEELTVVTQNSTMVYLGSFLRQFATDHPKSVLYDDARYHWVLARASTYTLVVEETIAEASWQHVSGLRNWAMLNMSEEKSVMFEAVLQRVANVPMRFSPVWAEHRNPVEA